MKKLIALSILVNVFATVAFAEITITGSAEAALVPLQIVSNDDDTEGTYVGAGMGRAMDPEGPLVQLNVAADYEERIGMNAQLNFFGGLGVGQNQAGEDITDGFSVGDFLELWVKPLDWIKVDVGHFKEDRLRGKIGDDNWSSFTVGMGGKNHIFHRLESGLGVLVGADIPMVEGLYVGVLLPNFAVFEAADPFLTGGSGSYGKNSQSTDVSMYRAANVYEQIQIAVGYEIQGTGLFRIQFVGAHDETDSSSFSFDPKGEKGYTPPRIEAAFAYTGLENLVVDLGLKFHIPYDSHTGNVWDSIDEKYGKVELNGTYMKPFQISVGAQYDMGDINIAGRIDTSFAGYFEPDGGKTYNIGPEVNFHLWPSYNLGFATVGLDFGLGIIGVDKYDGDTVPRADGKDQETVINVGFGAWLQKSFGDSSIKGGLAYRIPTDDRAGNKQQGVFSIPIVFEYSF